MKRILTVQDFSCVGKCSLTVALPVLSACGVEACALPTALLSSHTAFAHWSFADLTDQMQAISKKWEQEGILFDGLYTGYLGSVGSIAQTESVLKKFVKQGAPVLVDPVLGDHGKLYSGFDGSYVSAVRTLCSLADVITPNLTEAAFLADLPVPHNPSSADLDSLLLALGKICKNVVVTGVKKQEKIGAVCLLDGKQVSYFTDAARDMHGTGDLFASALFGALMQNKTLERAVVFACEFCKDCLLYSQSDPTAPAYGVSFEPLLSRIGERLN